MPDNPQAQIRAIVALGSNIPDRISWLQCGLDHLRKTDGIKFVSVSRVYVSEPVGEHLLGNFYNAVVAMDTSLSPRDLLAATQDIERKCGRNMPCDKSLFSDGISSVFRNRSLDLDVIFYGDDQINEPDLIVPHPRWHERAFVIMPLTDIIGELTVHQRKLVDKYNESLLDKTSCRPVDVMVY